MLTLTDAQKPLWKAYVDARMARFAEAPRDVKPAVDVQDRLERRAERLAARADRVKKIADTRAELLKSLSVEQKYVLESYEYRHRGSRRTAPTSAAIVTTVRCRPICVTETTVRCRLICVTATIVPCRRITA